jgi:NAD+ synthase
MEYAMLVAKEFNIRTELVHLNSVFNTVLSVLETKLEVTDRKSTVIANIKPRLRMITLYAFASKYKYLVCGTGNKSELLTGYFTKYGDGGVDILPLGGLLKTQVIELAKELKIPDVIISRPPTAGLWQGQTDESELGLTYAELDRIITAIEKNEFSGFDMRLVDRVRNMIMKSEHKRKTIPIFVIDS